MKILNKIEKIRQEPEHIRVRWAWGLTIFFMLIILGVWIILLNAERKMDNEPIIPEEQKEAIRELQNQKKSIEDTINDMKDTIGNKKVSQ